MESRRWYWINKHANYNNYSSVIESLKETDSIRKCTEIYDYILEAKRLVDKYSFTKN